MVVLDFRSHVSAKNYETKSRECWDVKLRFSPIKSQVDVSKDSIKIVDRDPARKPFDIRGVAFYRGQCQQSFTLKNQLLPVCF